jgi:predicted transcriptional regulator
MERKAVSLRLPDGMTEELKAIARANDLPMSELMREALEEFIVSRRSDKQFKERLAKRLEEDREFVEKFGS